jgi:GT2 family glycosyltransferase
MKAELSGYVPFYNNRQTIVPALQSLAHQLPSFNDVFAVDDASTDGGRTLVESHGFRCFQQPANLGRGAARHRAMLEATSEFVVCCDATNILPEDFVGRLLPWFEDPKIAAVYGRIQDRHPVGPVARWRSRHLFKAGHMMHVTHQAPLITYGTLMRRSAVLSVGNFNQELRHSEDAELGVRLLSAGFDIVFDPSTPVFCNTDNSLCRVLERYWRWHVGSNESISLKSYWKNILFSLKCMAYQDLVERDPLCAIISLICPHVQFWTTVVRSLTRI